MQFNRKCNNAFEDRLFLNFPLSTPTLFASLYILCLFLYVQCMKPQGPPEWLPQRLLIVCIGIFPAKVFQQLQPEWSEKGFVHFCAVKRQNRRKYLHFQRYLENVFAAGKTSRTLHKDYGKCPVPTQAHGGCWIPHHYSTKYQRTTKKNSQTWRKYLKPKWSSKLYWTTDAFAFSTVPCRFFSKNPNAN